MKLGKRVSSPSAFTALMATLLCFGNIPVLLAQDAPPSKPMPSVKTPVEIQADRLEYDREKDRYDAEGSVRVTQGPLRLSADKIILFNKTGRAEVTGNVFFFDGENSLEGARGEVNLRSREGVFYESRLVLEPGGYRIQGDVLEKLSDERYRVERGSFTTCVCEEPGIPDWQFRMREMRVQLEGYLVAQDVTFYVKKVPVFYVPWIVYPAKRERQTGLLIPRFGYSSAEGFKYDQSFFWAINPHMDATVGLDLRSRRGQGGKLEYRYKPSKQTEGSLSTLFFHDTEIDQNRLEFKYHHRQAFTPTLRSRLDIHYLTDDSLFRDLSDVTEERAQRSIESNLTVTQTTGNQFAHLLGRYTQDLNATNDQTLQMLPEIGYFLMPYRLGDVPLFGSVEGRATNFWRDSGVKARRLDVSPTLLSHLEPVSGVVVTPAVGFRETFYTREAASEESTRREVYWGSVRLDTKAARVFSGPSQSILKQVRHQLEPSVVYEYIEVDAHSPAPFFDELETLDSQHRVTYSLLQRVVVSYMKGEDIKQLERLELLTFKLTQSYNIRIPPPPVSTGSPDQRPFSDLRGEMTLRPPWPITLEVDSFLDVSKGRWNSVNSDLKFHFSKGWQMALGHRFTPSDFLPQRGDLFNPAALNQRIAVPDVHFMTLSTRIRFPFGVTLANRTFYDLDSKSQVEIDYGIQYESQCWAVAFAYQDLPEKDQYSFMISLKGTGAIESGLFHRLFFSP